MLKLSYFVTTTFLLSIAATGAESAELSDGIIKIGIMNNAASFAPGEISSVMTMNSAIDEFKAAHKNIKIETVYVDHKNKPDLAADTARRWYDKEKVDVIVDVTGSPTALAVNEVAREKKKILFVSNAYASDLTGKACSPYTVHWVYDTWVLANSIATIVTSTGAKTWGLLTVDSSFGRTLKQDMEAAITKAGGEIVENVMHPFEAPDLTPYLKKLQTSKAKIIGIANSATDTSMAITQSAKLGIGKDNQRVTVMLLTLVNVNRLGLDKTQGFIVPTPFYWDRNEKTRAWSKRFLEKFQQAPTPAQAGVYSSTLYYLKTVAAIGSDNSAAVMAKMKESSFDDPLFGLGRIRQDGRKVHNMYLYEVKTPSESRYPWDYLKQIALIPAETAFRSEKEGGCPLAK